MTERRLVGTYAGVDIHVAAWDGVAAAVDLSCACMFAREARGALPTGGLAHLDAALGGRLLSVRTAGLFQATRGETLLIDRAPPVINAGAVLVIGLGDPDVWSTEVVGGAVAIAYTMANLKGAARVAFAPSMLDSGLTGEQTSGAANRMLGALMRAIDLKIALEGCGQTHLPSVREWFFDVGAERFDQASAGFVETLHQLRSRLA
ncbi:M17 family peptidase N-terminal domain-containing protein [Sphingomonas abietis]|uniref:Peptidase M17 leucyl aminopeptidase N-terminal domain-containing protein n=1 Tax=Sphingomonas abietis TaxID=3012344 RepID=A0ABY7NKB0_9SPHN|nr:M17 family peptidase N-terminal domain-containing protein [Sphingomonas abietis]WBO21783.1 hypothetical protein PBT88_16665 [Sphingomonas abietis]